MAEKKIRNMGKKVGRVSSEFARAPSVSTSFTRAPAPRKLTIRKKTGAKK